MHQAEAIIASGMLEQAKLIGPLVSNHQITSAATTPINSLNACDVFAYQILELWFTCIKLLEDEDDPIRSKLATDVQKCFATGMEVPTQVEKVLELSFNHLSSVFGHWNEYSRDGSSTPQITHPHQREVVRRVFDKEIDNHHEEKLLILQFCCYHLQRLPNIDFSSAQLLEWRSKFHNQLLSFAKDHVGKQRESWGTTRMCFCHSMVISSVSTSSRTAFSESQLIAMARKLCFLISLNLGRP